MFFKNFNIFFRLHEPWKLHLIFRFVNYYFYFLSTARISFNLYLMKVFFARAQDNNVLIV